MLSGRIETANYLGGQTLYRIAGPAGLRLLAKETSGDDGRSRPIGSDVSLTWAPQDAILLER